MRPVRPLRRPSGRARAVLALLLAGQVAGCGFFDEEEVRLPGERMPVRQVAEDALAPPDLLEQARPLGPATALTDWTQSNAIASRAPGHIGGPAGLREAWRADAGAGSDSEAMITSAPIVANGLVYTLDAAATVSAFDAGSGREIWRASVAPEGEDPEDGFGGGLAWLDGRVFAATGFGEVVALGARDGAELWRRDLGAPMRAAPAVADGRVIVVTRDSAGFALSADDGSVLWRVRGAPGGAGVLGGASPALGGPIAVLPFASGELVAVVAANGRRLWSDALTGGRGGLAMTDISDVSGDPVVAGVGVYAANATGSMVAIDGRSGRRGWLRPTASDHPAWAVGSSLYVVTRASRLLRLTGATGEVMFAVDLPAYEDPEDREGVISYGAPVVADGRVYVTSSDDALLVFDAQTGEEVDRAALPGGSVTGAVIAGGALYILSDDGVLHAFR
jgi:outer membrane protein assembly factor BamB